MAASASTLSAAPTPMPAAAALREAWVGEKVELELDEEEEEEQWEADEVVLGVELADGIGGAGGAAWRGRGYLAGVGGDGETDVRGGGRTAMYSIPKALTVWLENHVMGKVLGTPEESNSKVVVIALRKSDVNFYTQLRTYVLYFDSPVVTHTILSALVHG